MIIKTLIIRNFQLFKEVTINFEKYNIITGTNFDDISASGNGAGKTTILNAILFALYGEVFGLTLKELRRNDTSETEVILNLTLNNIEYQIQRKIPTSLIISANKEIANFNTSTLAQNFLNQLLDCDIHKFRTYHIIDHNKGIDLLNLGIISLRKSLMEFVDSYFSEIRKSLLAKKLERERFNVDKKLYTFYLSDKKLNKLEVGLQKLETEYEEFRKVYKNQEKVVTNYKADIKTKEQWIYNKNKELKDAQKSGICPILKKKCKEITKTITVAQKTEIDKETNELQQAIYKLTEKLTTEVDYLHDSENQQHIYEDKIRKTQSYIMKLKEASKFKDYKYTKADVQLYSDTIKVLDGFASYYIQEWLSNLSLILNDLLSKINISVEFSADKQFIKVINNGEELTYAQLSSGQKTFLNTIFKIGILLNEGITEGTLLIDEGLSNLDEINLTKLLDILKGLNFQVFLIYQNVPQDIQEVNFINLERKDGESKIK